MSNAPDSRSTSAPGESRNGHFADSAARAGSYQAPHGFDVQAWINDGAVIDDARGDVTKPMRHEDPDLDFYDD